MNELERDLTSKLLEDLERDAVNAMELMTRAGISREKANQLLVLVASEFYGRIAICHKIGLEEFLRIASYGYDKLTRALKRKPNDN